MALRLEDKKALVAEVNEVASTALSAVAAEYRGLTVEQMTALRAEARKAGVYVRVVKNTLAKRAIEGTNFECLNEALQGPLVLAFSSEDPGAAARIFKAFARENDKLVTRAVSISGQLYPGSDLDRLASLPTLDGARAQLLALLNTPMTQFVRTINEPASQLARVLQAKADQG